jgi:hypothetical protein
VDFDELLAAAKELIPRRLLQLNTALRTRLSPSGTRDSVSFTFRKQMIILSEDCCAFLTFAHAHHRSFPRPFPVTIKFALAVPAGL